MQTIEGLKKEFAEMRIKEQRDIARTVPLFMVDGELSNEDVEYMAEHPEHHFLIFQESDKLLL